MPTKRSSQQNAITPDFLKGELGAFEKRFDAKIDSKIDAVEQRLDSKIDAVEQRLDSKIDAVGQRLDAKIDSKVDEAAYSFKEYVDSPIGQVQMSMGEMRQDINGIRLDISKIGDKLDISVNGIVEMLERSIGKQAELNERVDNHERRITALEPR